MCPKHASYRLVFAKVSGGNQHKYNPRNTEIVTEV